MFRKFGRTGEILTVLVAAVLICGIAAGEDNLLSNPSFERMKQTGVPEDWSRMINPKLSGPFSMVQDAHHGDRAAFMRTEEWNYQRPQYLVQTVQLPRGANSLTLSAYAKGYGSLKLSFRFLRAGEPHEVRKLNLGFGIIETPAEENHEFALAGVYDRYEAHQDIPAGAEAVMIKVGNTIGPLDRLNIWGALFVDQVSLTASGAAVPVQEPTHRVVSSGTIKAAGLHNVAHGCNLRLRPMAYDPEKLVDGDTETTPHLIGGIGRAARYDIGVPVAVEVRKLALYLPGASRLSRLDVRGDADGDGTFEKRLAAVRGIAGEAGWLMVELPAGTFRAIRVLPRKGRLWSFRRAASLFSELRVYVDADKQRAFARTGNTPAAPRGPARDLDYMGLEPVRMELPEVKDPQFRRGMAADLWMWGAHATRDGQPQEDYTNNPAFQRTTDMMKRMGVNSIMVDLTVASSRNLMPWPTKVGRGTEKNFLRPVLRAIKSQGFEAYVHLIHNISPFETVKWHYPEEETSRYPNMKQYPSIIHGHHFRDNWLALQREIMANGADGVGISSDEQYYRGHFMETFPEDDPARKLYRQRYGEELPGTEEDTLAYRRWIRMRHEGICDLFGYWTEELKKQYPDIYTYTLLMHYAHVNSYIEGTGIPVEMLGARGGITDLGADYMGPYGVFKAAAANGWRGATMTYNGNLGARNPDIHFYATTLWNWMYGGSSAYYWRFNYVVNKGSAPALARAYSMAQDLEAAGAFDARPPSQVCLLTSRAANDWYQVRSWWGEHDPTVDRGMEGLRGWFAEQTTFRLLQQNGIPFDWRFMETPGHMEGLEKYRVLLLPFAYAVNEEAAEAVRSAAEAGVTVILLDGQTGPTDGMGQTRETPAFADLVERENVRIIERDILDWGGTPVLEQQVLGLIDRELAGEAAFRLRRYHTRAAPQGPKVDATVLRNEAGDGFVFLINHSKSAVPADLQLSLPAGRYQVRVRDQNRWHKGILDGADTLTADQLRRFGLRMNGRSVYVIYLRKQ